MPYRKIKAKKYTGIEEFYHAKDPDKKTVAHRITYWNGEKPQRERIDTADREEARLILNQRKSDVSRGKLNPKTRTDKKDYTLDQVASEYFYHRQKRSNVPKDKQRYVKHLGDRIYEVKADKSRIGYTLTESTEGYIATIRGKGMVDRLYERESGSEWLSLGSYKISEITTDDISKMIKELQKKGLAAKTVKSIINLLKTIFSYAQEESCINADRNPFKSKKKTTVEVEETDGMRILKESELKEIFLTAKNGITKDGHIVYHPDKTTFMMFKMLYYTAQRPQSILDLRVSDIDLEADRISIRPIKGQRGTTIKIHADLKRLLRVWLKGCTDGKVIPLSYETLQNKAQKIFAPYNEGLDYKKDRHKWASMYSFRHTSATMILAKTGSLEIARTVLNHSNSKMTERYARVLDEAKARGIDVL